MSINDHFTDGKSALRLNERMDECVTHPFIEAFPRILPEHWQSVEKKLSAHHTQVLTCSCQPAVLSQQAQRITHTLSPTHPLSLKHTLDNFLPQTHSWSYSNNFILLVFSPSHPHKYIYTNRCVNTTPFPQRWCLKAGAKPKRVIQRVPAAINVFFPLLRFTVDTTSRY